MAVPAGLFAWLLGLAPTVAEGGAVAASWPWAPTLGVDLAVRLDGLGLLFALLITGVGTLIFLYSAAYMRGHARSIRFTLVLLLFMGAMLGIVAADDLIVLYVAWELTSLTSFLLIATDHEDREARRAAIQALVVTSLGGLCLLAALLLLGQAAGTFRLSGILATADLHAHPHAPAILALALIGALTKSAHVPVHFWLPNAMAAPTPVSAYLHSATMVKAGLYLLARLHPVLAEHPAWTPALAGFGGVTAVYGALLALKQTDIKRLLAYTTIMGLGLITLFLAGSAKAAVAAALTYLVVHALYKAALFLVAGILDHATGGRDMRRMGRLGGALPATCAAAVLASASMAGFPPFLGFVGKELTYKGALALAEAPLWAAVAAVAANALVGAAALRLALGPFFLSAERPPDDATDRPPREASPALWLGPLVLATAGLAFGLAPEWTGDWLIAPALAAVKQQEKPLDLALWHGVTVPLLLSVLTIALAVGLFLARRRVRGGLEAAVARWPLTASAAHDHLLAGVEALGRGYDRLFQGGRLTGYLRLVLASLAALPLGLLAWGGGWPEWPGVEGPVAVYEATAVGAIIAGAATVIVSKTRLLSIAALSTAGTTIAMLYVLYGAPDLAVTQLMVETLIAVVIASVLLRLPTFRFTQHLDRPWRRKLLDGGIAAGLGLAVTVLLLAATAEPLPLDLTRWFAEHAEPDGHGRNIVNVILVDFRAFDTLGEITVIMLAALGGYGLIRLRGGRPGRSGQGRRRP